MRERVLNSIGIGLLVVCFAISLSRILLHSKQEADPEVTTLRFAHWQLESGVRDALDAMAREYEAQWLARGRKVRVEQLAIPERVYPNWLVTQLVGGTAPDLIQLGIGINDERTARFFTPLTREVGEPNPYNKGTALESVPWRETFVDNLGSSLSYNPQLLEYYGIPMSIYTIRVFYNKALYREIAGDAPVPRTYEEFVALCRRTIEFGRAHRRPLVPIAGSRYNAPYLMSDLFASQTQRAMLAIDRPRLLHADDNVREMAFIDRRWSLHDEPVVAGLELMREVSGFMQPGFLEVSREDAAFYFAQQRALMVVTGSWDAVSFRSQAPFEIGVFPIPLPAADHPRYGKNMLGPFSEAGIGTGMSFGLTRSARDPLLALDFLHYLGSLPASRLFTERSGWLPAVVGVEPAAAAEPFRPFTEGYPEGFSLVRADMETARIVGKHMYLLPGENGLDAFLDALGKDYPRAVLQDLWSSDRGRARALIRNDTTLTALDALARIHPDDAEIARKRAELRDAQFGVELGHERSRWMLRERGLPVRRE